MNAFVVVLNGESPPLSIDLTAISGERHNRRTVGCKPSRESGISAL